MGSRELGTAPSIGFERATLNTVGNAEALNGADFNLCSPAEPATLGFDATTQFMGCLSDPARVTGGFIVPLGAPNQDELDCYGNGYGDKDFEGVLTITAVTGDEIQGETQGSGTCGRHPYSEIEPMLSVTSPFEYAFGLSDKPADEEFGLLRDRGRDSLEVWLFKVPDRKAVEIGNAIWAKWSRSHRRHFRGHGPGAA